MQFRAIFPIAMFVLAIVSFAYGVWQQLTVRALRASADERVAVLVETVEQSVLARSQKQVLYTSMFSAMPAAPAVLGIDVSGLFASQDVDGCTQEGQRSLCASLVRSGTVETTLWAICGECAPDVR
jgi:hypothetical protein